LVVVPGFLVHHEDTKVTKKILFHREGAKDAKILAETPRPLNPFAKQNQISFGLTASHRARADRRRFVLFVPSW
jgi:hypothetical protein